MKKFMILMVCLLLVGLCACGQTAPAGDPDQTTAAAGNAETTGGEETTAGTTEADLSPKEQAESCLEKPVADLYALIGEPQSSEYAPSCLNPGQGEDGMLYYDGFVVYTYKEGDTETVEYVE